MNYVINKLYYKIYMSEYYQKNREDRIEYQLSYYYKNRNKIRLKQNVYFKKYYRQIIVPSKILCSNPPAVNTTPNLTVSF